MRISATNTRLDYVANVVALCGSGEKKNGNQRTNWFCLTGWFQSIFILRYNQSTREGVKLTNDGQQSVPLCSTSDVQLRFLCPDDLEEVDIYWVDNFYPLSFKFTPTTFFQVQTLCQDWFPIDYPLMWYKEITSSTRFYALAAVYNLTIIGLIVAEIKPYCRLNKEVSITVCQMEFGIQQIKTNSLISLGSWHFAWIDGQRLRRWLHFIVGST